MAQDFGWGLRPPLEQQRRSSTSKRQPGRAEQARRVARRGAPVAAVTRLMRSEGWVVFRMLAAHYYWQLASSPLRGGELSGPGSKGGA